MAFGKNNDYSEKYMRFYSSSLVSNTSFLCDLFLMTYFWAIKSQISSDIQTFETYYVKLWIDSQDYINIYKHNQNNDVKE